MALSITGWWGIMQWKAATGIDFNDMSFMQFWGFFAGVHVNVVRSISVCLIKHECGEELV